MRSELHVGAELDRERIRVLARELRRHRALAHAARALRVRDRTAAEVDARLEGAGYSRETREQAREALARGGLLDDERVARTRAVELARRGRGDAAIRWDLEHRGLAPEAVEAALAELEPEPERARRLGLPAAALARRGFSEDVVAFEGDLGIGYGD